MADNPTPGDIDLETFLKLAGQSFTDAQRALVPGLDVSVNMMLSSAELEVKVAVSSDVRGKMSIRPISSEDKSVVALMPVYCLLTYQLRHSVGEIMPQPVPAVDSTVKEILCRHLWG